MISKEGKRLHGVDFPIVTIPRHAARVKSIRGGLPDMNSILRGYESIDNLSMKN